MKKAIILGGGFAGCAAAHVLSLKGDWDVTVLEASSWLGAGVKTQHYGGHPYTFGPRHFLTQIPRTYEFLDKYLPLRRCSEHIFWSYVAKDENFYNYPIHVDDISRMPESGAIANQLASCNIEKINKSSNLEEYWTSSVGDILYKKFIKSYSEKMWCVSDNRMIDDFGWSPKGVALKEGPKEAWDTALSAYPIAADGYDSYFEVATANAKVRFKCVAEAFDFEKKKVRFDGEWHNYDILISSISPDLLFDQCYGVLKYVGRQFHKFVLPVQFAMPENVYFLYYTGEESFTRIVEYKKLTRQKWEDKTTILGLEIPVIDGGRHYPMPLSSEISLAQQYFDELPDDVFCVGRTGTYRYGVDIDDCIEHALQIGESV